MDLFQKVSETRIAEDVKASGFFPYFRTIQSGQDAEVVVEGRRMIMLGSNNYLGLTAHPKVKLAAMDALLRYGTGCAGSRVLNGTLDLHEALEAYLRRFFRRDGALAFTSGYQANLGVISALASRSDVVVVDRLAHASIFDACHLAQTEVRRFRHNNPESLDAVLGQLGDRGKLVAIDGVYSMTGDIAPLPEIVAVCKKHGARLMVDDAHGLGVLGRTGRGTAEHFGLEQEVDVIVGTTSKAVPSVGGFAVGNADVIWHIQQTSRPFLFAASAPPSAVAATLAGFEVIDEEPVLRERLWANTRRIHQAFRAMGLDIGASATPIVPVMTGDLDRALIMGEFLDQAGLFVNPVMPPAVPPSSCLIRTSYMATHTDAQLDRVIDLFAQAGALAGLVHGGAGRVSEPAAEAEPIPLPAPAAAVRKAG